MWLDAGTAYQVPIGREGLAAAGGTFGSGIVLPLGDGTCPLGEVSRIASYLAGESAGQCGPCKLGLPTIARALASIIDGSGGIEALDVARRAAATSAAAAPARTRTVRPGSCSPRSRSSPRTWPRTSSTLPAAGRSAAFCRCRTAGGDQREAAHGRLGALRGPRALRPPGAGADPPGQDGLPCRPPHPGAAVAGEERAAGRPDVPRARAAPDTDPRKREASVPKAGPIPVIAPGGRTGLLGGRKSITAG